MGERPSHPELLDYLAARFVESGWSIKAMHREMMLTEAYQRSAEYIGKNNELDPDNLLLWRFNRRRMDVEALRDTMLSVTGTLDAEVGGPPVPLTKEENHRRTVYGWVSRRSLDRVLGLFDFPNPNNTSPRRIPTNTPLQGLFFLNSDFVMEAAETLAERIAQEGANEKASIERAYWLAYSRAPTAEELKLSRHFLRQDSEGWSRLAQVLLSSNEFLYVD
jgi:hypothetical protein